MSDARIPEQPAHDRPAPALVELVDPALVLGKLLRELGAAQVLLSLSETRYATRRELLNKLALCHDIVEDARRLAEHGAPEDRAPMPTAETLRGPDA